MNELTSTEIVEEMIERGVLPPNALPLEQDLLPPNATALERKLSRLTTVISQLPVDTGKLWDTEQCGEPFLPWLAWTMAVNYWQPDWHENVKRTLIQQSMTVHQQRGTRAAVRQAVRLVLALADQRDREDISNIDEYDNSFLIREWWEPRGEQMKESELPTTDTISSRNSMRHQPLTFDIQLLIGRGVLGGRGLLRPELYRELRRAVDAVKPMSTRYTLSIGGAKLETEVPIKSAVRAVRKISFTVNAKMVLKLESQLPLKNRIRTVEAQFLRMSARNKLLMQKSLPVQNTLRTLETHNLVFKLPILSLKKIESLKPLIRASVLIRLSAKLEDLN